MPNKEKNEEIVDQDLVHAIRGGGRCTYLLLSLIALIVITPFGSDSEAGGMLLIVMRTLIYVSGVYFIASRSRILFLVIGIAITTSFLEIASLFSLFGNIEFLYNSSIVSATLLYIYFTKHILNYILIRGPVTADKLHGAMAIFITLAYLWTDIYVLVENLMPGSFSFATEPNLGDPWRYYDLLFFSFATLTTTGYGDITPTSEFTRMLSVLEQIVGVFMVAVLIARLAGIYPAHMAIKAARRSAKRRLIKRRSRPQKRP